MAKSSPPHPNQLTFPDKTIERSGLGQADLAWGQRLRSLMLGDLRRCGLSRQQIADQMSLLLSQPVTVHQMNAWTAETKINHRMPLEYLPAWCAATGSLDLLRDAGQFLGARIASQEDMDLAELGRAELQARRAARRKRARLDLLEGRE